MWYVHSCVLWRHLSPCGLVRRDNNQRAWKVLVTCPSYPGSVCQADSVLHEQKGPVGTQLPLYLSVGSPQAPPPLSSSFLHSVAESSLSLKALRVFLSCLVYPENHSHWTDNKSDFLVPVLQNSTLFSVSSCLPCSFLLVTAPIFFLGSFFLVMAREALQCHNRTSETMWPQQALQWWQL